MNPSLPLACVPLLARRYRAAVNTKSGIRIALTAALTVCIASCGSADAEDPSSAGSSDFDLVKAGTLTLCTDAPYEPFEFPDPSAASGYSGFDIEIIDAIAKSLTLDIEVKDLGFDGLQSGASLAAGQCDVVVSAMTITEEREANLDFTDAYYDSKQSLLAPTEAGIGSLADLAGHKLGVQQGTTGAAYAEQNVPDSVELVAFPSDAELYASLESNGVAAVLQDLPVNLQHTEDSEFMIVEEYATDEQYGFAVKEEGNEDLLAAINDSLAGLRDDGTYDEIYEKYFGS